MNDTEYTDTDSLKKLSDKELEKLAIEGPNLHIVTSKASLAKRVLENRRQLKQLKIAKDVKKSGDELAIISSGLKEVVKILNFFRKKWFPKQAIWIRVFIFLLGTVAVGIALNLASDAIAKFVLGW